MTDPTHPFVTTVRRPGLADVHLGFWYEHQAEEAAASLTSNLRSSQHVEGTTITYSPTPDAVEPLPLVPTEIGALAELVDQEPTDLPMGHAFPDLFDRLTAQEGYEQASRIWSRACAWLADDGSED